ncbi:hypothetical protein FOZ62_031990, partial [Perkinsus olseni]
MCAFLPHSSYAGRTSLLLVFFPSHSGPVYIPIVAALTAITLSILGEELNLSECTSAYTDRETFLYRAAQAEQLCVQM